MLSELVIEAIQKRLGISKNESKNQNLKMTAEERKAEVIRKGNKVLIIPKSNTEYTPNFVINNIELFENVLIKYLEAIKTTNIKSTKMDERHNEKYFLFNIWKNATCYDYLNPEEFISRYTNFILDNTFEQYNQLTPLGFCENQLLMVKRNEDDYAFETPYIMHFSFTNGKNIYNLPWVRYGVSRNKLNEKVVYIYALQRMEESPSQNYNEDIKKMLNKANSRVKRYRNVTPSAIVTLAVFLGMLKKEGIKSIKVPDFLIGRYNSFSNVTDDEKRDQIQTNLTDKFFRNFLRLSEQFNNVELSNGIGNGIDSFLCVDISRMTEGNNEFLNLLYNLGRNYREKNIAYEDER